MREISDKRNGNITKSDVYNEASHRISKNKIEEAINFLCDNAYILEDGDKLSIL